jgi:hypothetical protein
MYVDFFIFICLFHYIYLTYVEEHSFVHMVDVEDVIFGAR